jgi:hypothetical protein
MVNVFRATELRECEVKYDKGLEEVPEGYTSAPKREKSARSSFRKGIV